MSPRPSTSDPIRDQTVKAIANALFAEMYKQGKTGLTWENIHQWAGEVLDDSLQGSHLPTLEDVRHVVENAR